MSVSGMMSLRETASSLLNCSSKHSAPVLRKRAKDEETVSTHIYFTQILTFCHYIHTLKSSGVGKNFTSLKEVSDVHKAAFI